MGGLTTKINFVWSEETDYQSDYELCVVGSFKHHIEISFTKSNPTMNLNVVKSSWVENGKGGLKKKVSIDAGLWYAPSDFGNSRIMEKVYRISSGDVIVKILDDDVWDILVYLFRHEPRLAIFFPETCRLYKEDLVKAIATVE